MENAIEIRNLCKSYPSFCLKDVNISLPKGYIMGFIGANGRGKSTTISTLLGLRKAGDDVFFVTGGAVDDEWGYVITGDSAVGMNGLWQLERVDGHVYRFSTRK